ncbi:MAG: valine--pyruvate transaminase [Treponemataceae bacterium]
MTLSSFGDKFTRKTGILELMEDLAEAADFTASKSDAEKRAAPLCMLGGGNPARIPAVEAVWRERMGALLSDEEGFGRLIGAYDSADGMTAFRTSLSALFKREYGWNVGPENVCVTNGSQIAVWYLLNLLSGPDAQGRRRRVLFPLMPEYVGYADQGVHEDVFVSCKPRIELHGDDRFKYYADMDAVEFLLRGSEPIGGILVSRPTNPSGNVLTDQEIIHLAALAKRYDVPLIVDNAYGLPFPGIVFTEAKPYWDESVVLSMSLSKIGLPSARTGIIVARKEIIAALSSTNAIASLATGTIGQAIAEPLIASGDILRLSRDVVRPYYVQKRARAFELMKTLFAGMPIRVHESEGAIFMWLWFDGLPITSRELYKRLKARSVMVLSGDYFSFGRFADGSPCSEWDHPRRCIRINYSSSDDQVERGLSIIAEEARKAYSAGV